LNRFISLISTIRESSTAIFLSHLGSDPLEHAFGQARVRCRDVSPTENMLKAFSFNLEKISRRPFLDLLCAPQARHSMGIICEPRSESPDSELTYRPFDITVSLLEAIGSDLTRVLGTGHHQSTPSWRISGTPWYCLRSLLAFSCPQESDALKGSVFRPLLKTSPGEHMRDKPHWFHLQVSSFWGS
jgi:hypothetical protein